MDTNGRGTVFHPLNGSDAKKGTTGRSNAGRRKQKDSPKPFTQGIPKQGWGFVRLYRTSPKFPLVYLFFFGVQNRFFFCSAKEKAVLALAGQAEKQSPAGQAKTNCKIKPPRFPTKEKALFPARATPYP